MDAISETAVRILAVEKAFESVLYVGATIYNEKGRKTWS